jgi:hypothetical protein
MPQSFSKRDYDIEILTIGIGKSFPKGRPESMGRFLKRINGDLKKSGA